MQRAWGQMFQGAGGIARRLLNRSGVNEGGLRGDEVREVTETIL